MPLDDIANASNLDRIFRKARTHNAWQAKDISDDLLREIYELMKWGPTGANSCPARLLFVRSPEAKAKLLQAMDAGNVEKTRQAPVTVVFAYDLAFYDQLPFLFPHADARSWFAGKDELVKTTAFRNGSLQAGYFMLAARAMGLDCGPMSGFDAALVDELFFQGSSWRSNFVCNLGYGDPSALFPRSPRLAFDQACRID